MPSCRAVRITLRFPFSKRHAVQIQLPFARFSRAQGVEHVPAQRVVLAGRAAKVAEFGARV